MKKDITDLKKGTTLSGPGALDYEPAIEELKKQITGLNEALTNKNQLVKQDSFMADEYVQKFVRMETRIGHIEQRKDKEERINQLMVKVEQSARDIGNLRQICHIKSDKKDLKILEGKIHEKME